ncbi:hypothetical protein VKT23_002463 [Stygiomarasmius scandens]|uniref:Manganese/iron superoxide dismutase C-terminal domain-containing protein n=1 Tax=Marasmiellus scandens TaxID=2682957 RepID=A0ABR1K7M2_9AGAR
MRRFTVSSLQKWAHPLGRRALHYAPSLRTRVEQGLGNFLPPPAYKVVAVDYQQGLLQRLNEEVKDTELEGLSIVDTIIKTAPERSNVLAFNYASLALNNHFFLSQLVPPPSNSPSDSHQHLISLDLQSEIRNQHGTLAQLKSAFSAAAMGMFTNGFVWFVTDAAGNTGIIPTFGPGTLLVRSRTYMAHAKELLMGEGMLQYDRGDPLDKNDPYSKEWEEELAEMVTGVKRTKVEEVDYEAEADVDASAPTPAPTQKTTPPGVSPSSPASGVSGSNQGHGQVPGNSRSLHTSSILSNNSFNNTAPSTLWDNKPSSSASSPLSLNNNPLAHGYNKTKSRSEHYRLTMGETLYPLFCVSVHEHAWMSAGYGVWGKERWLKEFWSVLDWEQVSRAYDGYKTGVVDRETL